MTGWRAGVAKVAITPPQSIWMAGYAARKKPSEGVRQDIYAKALALEDGRGTLGVLVTADLIGFRRALEEKIAERCRREHGLERDRLILNASHTHSGPVVGQPPSYATLDARQTEIIERYTAGLMEKVVALVGQSIRGLAPAVLAFEQGLAGIAVNRRRARAGMRRLPAPVDHDVPVLSVRAADGSLRAVAAGYACHATSLGDYLISGDWPGFAQHEIERAHPGAVAMFVQGCGADANPLPRYQGSDPGLIGHAADLPRMYGKIFGAAVELVLQSKMKSIGGGLATAFATVDLPFQGVRAPGYPYPVQVWRFGRELKLIALGGEVTVDYSLRLKAQHGWDDTWVAAYSNDVFGYVPSLRVLKEGGYEGGEANRSLPGRFSAAVEEIIVEKVAALVEQTGGGVA